MCVVLASAVSHEGCNGGRLDPELAVGVGDELDVRCQFGGPAFVEGQDGPLVHWDREAVGSVGWVQGVEDGLQMDPHGHQVARVTPRKSGRMGGMDECRMG